MSLIHGAGRICVVGGSFEYTGAPYYSAMSALKSGGDLAMIICTQQAGIPLKAYSPEFIVYPYMHTSSDGSGWSGSTEELNQLEDSVKGVLEKAHTIVVGPGLGRDDVTLAMTERLIECGKSLDKSFVIDGDGLWLISKKLHLIKGYTKAILTPNAMELKRICDAIAKDSDSEAPTDDFSSDEGRKQLVRYAATHLSGPVLLSKGATDFISDGKTDVVEYGEDSSPRRCGGQGDVMAGVSATFAAWAAQSHDAHALAAAALGGSIVTRAATKRAFSKHKRSMTTPDAIAVIGEVMEELFPSDA